jgi:hypothetical protein
MTTRRLRFAVGAALLVGTSTTSGCEPDPIVNPVFDSGTDAGRDATVDSGEEINVYPDTGPEPDTGIDAGEEIINVGDSGPPPDEDAGLEAGVEDAGTEDAGPSEA